MIVFVVAAIVVLMLMMVFIYCTYPHIDPHGSSNGAGPVFFVIGCGVIYLSTLGFLYNMILSHSCPM